MKIRKFLISSLVLLSLLELFLIVFLITNADNFGLRSLKTSVKETIVKINNGSEIPFYNQESTKFDVNYDKPESIGNFIRSAQEHIQDTSTGYRKIPKQLGFITKKCSNPNELSLNLVLVHKGMYKLRTAYAFYRQNETVTSIIDINVINNECTNLINYQMTKTNLYWLVWNKFQLPIKGDGFPAHFRNVDDSHAILASKDGRFYIFDKIKHQFKELNIDLKLNLSSKFGLDGIKSVEVLGKQIYFAYTEGGVNCLKLSLGQGYLDDKYTKISNISIIYKSPHCFNKTTTNLAGIGGRIAINPNDSNNIYFSLGNAEIWTGAENIKTRAPYGSIMKYNPVSKKVSVFSIGHRNPQGLCFYDNKLIETEQGPEGGDELNILNYNSNYGWPNVSYGHPYSNFFTPLLGRKFGTHDGYIEPIFSWVPSIATGDLVCPSQIAPPMWKENYLMATLKDMSLHRIKIIGGRLVLDERIPLGERIRDLQLNVNGGLELMTDSGNLVEVTNIPIQS